MTNPLLKTLISEMMESYLSESIPSTVSRGRLAVINGQAKIKRIGGYYLPREKTFYHKGKEIGHEENGRSYFDRDIIQKYGFPTLTNAHMDL